MAVHDRVAHAEAPGDHSLGYAVAVETVNLSPVLHSKHLPPRVAGSTQASAGTWAPPRKGVHEAFVQAHDVAHRVQDARVRAPFPTIRVLAPISSALSPTLSSRNRAL